MLIIKNGFYKASELKSDNIIIGDNIIVSLFDDSKGLKQIEIGENSQLEYFSFFSKEAIYNKHFLLKNKHSIVKVNSLIYSQSNTINAQIIGELDADSSQIDLNILSFAGKDGNIKLEGILKINSQLKKVKGQLDEENIFLGESGKISGIPTLLVETNDVEASHSCKMERISDDKLFYLRSRGVEKQNAMRMIIEAKIKDLFRCLSMYNHEFYEDFIEETLEKIN